MKKWMVGAVILVVGGWGCEKIEEKKETTRNPKPRLAARRKRPPRQIRQKGEGDKEPKGRQGTAGRPAVAGRSSKQKHKIDIKAWRYGQGTVPMVSKGKVKLIQGGQKPRRKLRYRFAEKKYGPLAAAVVLAFETKRNGKTHMIPAPKLKFALDMWATKYKGYWKYGEFIKVDGYRIASRITDVAVAASGSDEIQQQLAQKFKKYSYRAKAFLGIALMDRCGVLANLGMVNSGGIKEIYKQVLDKVFQFAHQPVVPLPEKPVGKGAKWEVKRVLYTFELKAREKVQYTLTELNRKGGVVKFKVSRTAAVQPWRAKTQHPALLKDYTYSALGTHAFQLDTPLSNFTLTEKTSRRIRTNDALRRYAYRLKFTVQHTSNKASAKTSSKR